MRDSNGHLYEFFDLFYDDCQDNIVYVVYLVV